MKKNIIWMIMAALLVGSCGTTKNEASYRELETECLGTEGDGSQTLRVWAFGKDDDEAVERARKNAVRDVLFKGITKGVAGCNQRPLVPEVNAREKYADYFDSFFANGGPYREFVSGADERLYGREETRNSLGVRSTVVVRVLRPELRMRLKQDGILK